MMMGRFLCFLRFSLMAFLSALPAFAQTPQPPKVGRPRMDELRIEHLRVLEEMSVKDAKGRPMDLDDPRIPPNIWR